MKNRRKRFCGLVITRPAKKSLNSVSHFLMHRMGKAVLKFSIFVGAVYFLAYTFLGVGSDTIAKVGTENKSTVTDTIKSESVSESESSSQTDADGEVAVSAFAVSEAEVFEEDRSDATGDVSIENTDSQEDFINPTLGVLTSSFGSRWGRQHHGIDIGGDSGTEIYAALSGSVIFAGTADGYGNYIKLKHGNGYETAYGHCKSIVVKEGQYVEKGQLIAYMGSTGNSTGPHLHFEVKIDGEFVNPLEYVVY